MILRDLPGHRLLAIDQDDHARMCGPLAAHFRPRPSESVILAAAEHDNGWREWDRRPLLDPDTGRPFSYRDMPKEPYVHVWERGIRRAHAIDDTVALLVSLHGTRFFEGRIATGTATNLEAAFYRNQRTFQNAILARSGHPEATWESLPEAIAHDFGVIRFLDSLSLFLVERWVSPTDAPCPMGSCEISREADRTVDPAQWAEDVVREEAVVVKPFGFDAPISVECPARILGTDTFPGQDALDQAFAAARPVTLQWQIAPEASARHPAGTATPG